jgi:tRNA(Ile)-lysidine synthase
MLSPGQHAGVAVSGGADSVCLLHLLASLAASWNLRLTVLHLDHGLRGEESFQDAELVRALAASLGLPIEIRRASLAGVPGNCEQAARTARLDFFRDALAAHSLDRVALGHTRSDQAETVLFRFLRGSGTAGLAAIRPATPAGIVRPLLEISRDEVRQFLRDRGLPWREDSSNASPHFARNRIRHDLLPQLRDGWNPAIEATLAHTADWALAEESWWEAEIDRLAADLFAAQDGRLILSAEALRDLPLAPARRLIRRAIAQAKGDLSGIDFSHGEAVLALAKGYGGTGCFQAAGVLVRRSFDWLCFTAITAKAHGISGYRLPAAVPGLLPLPGLSLSISLELLENTESSARQVCVYNKDVDFLDWQRLSGPLELRSWRPGDLYQPLGSTAEKKLKALFQEGRVPVWERPTWPVLTDRGAIVWSRRFGPAAAVAAGRGAGPVLKIQGIGMGPLSVYSTRAGWEGS